MQEEGLVVKSKRHRKYCSYQGEIFLAVSNVLKGDFHTDEPNTKWLTDIIEFAISTGEVYYLPIWDCFDGMLLC